MTMSAWQLNERGWFRMPCTCRIGFHFVKGWVDWYTYWEKVSHDGYSIPKGVP